MTDITDVKTIRLTVGAKHIVIIDCETWEHVQAIDRQELQDALSYFMESNDEVMVMLITPEYKIRVEKVEEETVNEDRNGLSESANVRSGYA